MEKEFDLAFILAPSVAILLFIYGSWKSVSNARAWCKARFKKKPEYIAVPVTDTVKPDPKVRLTCVRVYLICARLTGACVVFVRDHHSIATYTHTHIHMKEEVVEIDTVTPQKQRTYTHIHMKEELIEITTVSPPQKKHTYTHTYV